MGFSTRADASGGAAASRLKHIEGIRAVAALVVFVNHAYAQVWEFRGVEPPRGVLSIFSYSMIAGHLSVVVFITLSGFCLALPLLRTHGELGSTRAFLKRRARRILPPYYGAVALSLGLIWTIIGEPTGSLWDVAEYVTPHAIVSHVLLLQDFFATGTINYVFWSIAVEFQIYLLFPIMARAWKRLGPYSVVAIALVLGYAITCVFAGTRIYRANPHFVGIFALGVLAAHVALSTDPRYAPARERVPWAWLCALALVPVVVLTLHWGIGPSMKYFPVLDLFMGLATTCLLVLTSRANRGVLRSAFSFAPLSSIGVFSYSLYLIHAPLLQIIWQYGLRDRALSREVTFGVLMSLGAWLVLGVSYMFYRVFEEPFMRSPRGLVLTDPRLRGEGT